MIRMMMNGTKVRTSLRVRLSACSHPLAASLPAQTALRPDANQEPTPVKLVHVTATHAGRASTSGSPPLTKAKGWKG